MYCKNFIIRIRFRPRDGRRGSQVIQWFPMTRIRPKILSADFFEVILFMAVITRFHYRWTLCRMRITTATPKTCFLCWILTTFSSKVSALTNLFRFFVSLVLLIRFSSEVHIFYIFRHLFDLLCLTLCIF